MSSENKYPLCHQIGAIPSSLNVIYPNDLEAILQKATVVYGQGIEAMKSSIWNMNGPDFERYRHTHSALLIGITQIKKKTLVEKISAIVNDDDIDRETFHFIIKKLIEDVKHESI